jgi:hypothetical protein
MNKDTQSFVKHLLLKYNSYQQLPDPECLHFNNSSTITEIDGQPIELECVDAFSLIKELCVALDLKEDESDQ